MPHKDPEARRAYNAAHYQRTKATADARNRAWVLAHPEASRTHKRKSRAKHRETINATHRAKRVERGDVLRARARQRRAERGEALRAKNRAYARQHATRVREVRQRWLAGNPDKPKQYKQKSYRKNLAKVMAANKAWRLANPDKTHNYVTSYRARRRKAPVNDFSAAQWKEMKEATDFRCTYCDRKMQRLEMDHIVPLSQGGSHTASNIVPACKSCNSSKQDGPPPVPVQPLLLTIAPAKKSRKKAS